MLIRSIHNSKIKNVIKLINKSRERKKQHRFIVEGNNENQLAIKNYFTPIEFFICPSIYLSEIKINSKIYQISESVYKKIAFRGTTEGIIGIYKIPSRVRKSVFLPTNSTVLIVESIDKPGNLGAILRICDSFSINLLIICDETINVFNPNVIRSSIGCVFTIPFYIMTKEDCLEFCLKNKLKIFTTFMNKNVIPLSCVDFKCNLAIIFGNEHGGINSFWEKYSNENFNIPMYGQINSFNVSNAIAITLYEVFRQKNIF